MLFTVNSYEAMWTNRL